MRSFPRTIWQYATLLILLFVIASVAAWTTISDLYSLSDLIPDSSEYSRALDLITFKIWAQTMGLLLIAGAFGLWAIKFSAEFESRRRIAQMVEGMNFMNDGLLLLDKNDQVVATNPSLKAMVSTDMLNHTALEHFFPFLTSEDTQMLLGRKGPNEMQKDFIGQNGKQTLRFRSQTAGANLLLFVSDVTTLRINELHKQHIARFELIGRLARGVTKDFNTILTGISGHASLLLRLPSGGTGVRESVNAIIQESERGAILAGHLLDFSRLGVMGSFTDNLGHHVVKAGELARMGLSSGWQVETDVRSDFPVVPLSGLQIEQVVLNLALGVADNSQQPGTIRIVAGRPSSDDHLMNVGNQFAAVILISSMNPGSGDIGRKRAEEDRIADDEHSGVIQSVARSLVVEAGGSLDFFHESEGPDICRIILPYGVIETDLDSSKEELAMELRSYIAHWKVLLARPTRGHDYLDEALKESGVTVDRVDNVVAALAKVESDSGLHSIILDKDLLGNEASGLLRAVTKLRPTTGVVVLCDDPDQEGPELNKDIVFVRKRTEPGRIIVAMVEAKTLAAQRRNR